MIVNKKVLIDDIFKIAKENGNYIEDDISITENKINFRADEFSLTFILNRLKLANITVEKVSISCDDNAYLHCEFAIN